MSANAISFNLKRLRNVKGMTQEAVAKHAGLSRVAYSNIENGKAEPRVKTLQKIADILNVGIQSLVMSVPSITSLRFRSLKTLSLAEKSKREQLVCDVATWLKDFNEVEKMLGQKEPYRLEDFSFNVKDPLRVVAEKVRTILDLESDEVINDICGLLENAGIKIYPIKSDLDKFFGLSVAQRDGGPAVGVNIAKHISVERQIFTVAHELGHLILHKDSYNAHELRESKIQEQEASEFASCFIMPQNAFKNEWEKNEGMDWVDNVLHIKRIFKVSYGTILKRLIDIGMADKSLWRMFNIAYNRKFRKSLANHIEPDGIQIEGLEPCDLKKEDFAGGRLSRLVREVIEKELISSGRAAEILHMGIEDIRERMNSWKMLK